MKQYYPTTKDPVTNKPSCYYRFITKGLYTPDPAESRTLKLVYPIEITEANFPQDLPVRFFINLPGVPDYSGAFDISSGRSWTIKLLRGATWITLNLVPYTRELGVYQVKIFPSTSENCMIAEVHNGTIAVGDYFYFDGYFFNTGVHADDLNHLGEFEEIDTNITLGVNKKYFANGDFDLNLPPDAKIGNFFEIMSAGCNKIIQNNGEDLIQYQGQRHTTKGVNGSLILQNRNFARLIYKGEDEYKDDTFTKLANPADLPTGNGHSSSFSYDGNYLAVAHVSSPYISIYKRNGDTFTKLANPATLPTNNGVCAAFSYDGNYLAVGVEYFPSIVIYKRNGDVFTKLPDPAILPAGYVYGIAFSYDGNYLATCSMGGTPYLTIYKRNGDVFTKLADPAAIPSNGGRCAFSYDGNYLAVSHVSSPYISIYKRNGDVFTKLANPATLPVGNGHGAAFSYDGNYLAVAHMSSPYLTIYKRIGDTFIKLADPANLPTGSGQSCDFSYDGNYLVVSYATTPYISIYKRNGDTFTKLPDPAILPAGYGDIANFSYNGNYLAVGHDTTPFITIYKTIFSANKTWLISELNTTYPEDLIYMFK